MNLTIIVEDKAVYVDGFAQAGLDLSACGIPNEIHALQWKTSLGWIEFVDNADGSKPANEVINALPQWVDNCVTAFNNKVKADAEALALAQAQAATNQPKTVGLQTL